MKKWRKLRKNEIIREGDRWTFFGYPFDGMSLVFPREVGKKVSEVRSMEDYYRERKTNASD